MQIEARPESLMQPNPVGKYDPDQMPADWDFAKKHAKAVRPGHRMFRHTEACPCCLNFIQKKPFSFGEDNKELAFLGQGFPLFYNFLKFCMIMLLALILDSSILGIYFGSNENQCQEYAPTTDTTDSTAHRLLVQTKCSYSVATKYAYISQEHQPDYRRIFKILAFVVQLLILLYFREKQNELAAYLDEMNTTITDYTILVEGLPKKIKGVEEKFRNLIKHLEAKNPDNSNRASMSEHRLETGDRADIEIMETLLIQDCKEFHKMEKDLERLVQQKKQAVKKKKDQEVIDDLDFQYKEKLRDLKLLTKKMSDAPEEYSTGSLFVTLNSEDQKDRTIELINNASADEIRQVFQSYNEKEAKFKVHEANEPKEIMWENIHYSFRERMVALLLGWLGTIVFIAIITIGFFFLIRYKSQLVEEALHKYSKDPAKYKSEWQAGTALVYIIVILIGFFNKYVLSTVAHEITHMEKHTSSSNYQLSFALKYTLGMFFTTALMTLAVEAIVFNNYIHAFGVVEEETFMFVFNAFFAPLMMFFDPFYASAWIKQKCAINSDYYTQKEANHIMEVPEYNMGKRYAEILKTMLFTFLYCDLIPFGPIFSFAGILVYYCVDKWVLFRRSSVSNTINSKLSTRMITVLEFTLILKPSGDLLFDSQMRGDNSSEDWAMFGIAILYILLPLNRILRCWFGEKYATESKKYEAVKQFFAYDYKTLYPPHKYQVHLNTSGKRVSLTTQMKKNILKTLGDEKAAALHSIPTVPNELEKTTPV